ncbi:MAG: hypothetical protein P8L44_01695 [Opitutales bacterium]|jgi:hypothetical protein|nr:hypothetical protein [bacterium]MDG2166623.1 hypothetical protein [Opitutales bacterium]
MNTRFKSSLTIFICLLLTGATMLSAKENRVAVKSKASPEFSIQRSTEGKKIQTYHVIEGKFFGGNTDDVSMQGVTFMDIANNLAANLQRQGFYSAQSDDEGDLLIVINYGATDYDADYQELMGIDSLDDLGFGAGAEENEELDEFEAQDAFISDFNNMQAMNDAGNMDKIFKAKLLGLEELFNDSASVQDVYEFEDMVNEERYFIFLVAFDLPSYRKGEKKVMWTTRYSMRAIGQPFDEAIAQLNTVASHYFGLNMKGMQNRRASDNFEVQIGEIEVIESESSQTN